MSSWATEAEFEERVNSTTLNKLLDDTNDPGLKQESLDNAEAHISSYLGKVTSVSVLTSTAASNATLDSLLRNKTLDFAECWAWTKVTATIPDSIMEKHKAAQKWLDDVVKGNAVLPGINDQDDEEHDAIALGADRNLKMADMESL